MYRRCEAWWKSRRRLHESANRGDAKTDALLAVGKLRDTDRWKHTATHARELKKVLGEYSVYPHNLGGTLAQHVHDEVLENQGRLVGFNLSATLLAPIPYRDASRTYPGARRQGVPLAGTPSYALPCHPQGRAGAGAHRGL